jgi:3',5'-cyclic AMP phosphodiesterase CpdA
MALRIVHVSDTHFGLGVPHADEQWATVVAHVAATRPDLVVHTGDVSLDGATDGDHLAHSRRRFDDLTAPWLALPGNHDIGDVDDDEHPVDDARRQRWRDVFGDLWWACREGGWRLVGLDIQTLCSTSSAADEHWAWLHDALAGHEPTALFLHRPLRPWGDATEEPRRYVTEPERGRLLGLVASSGVRVVASGHVHQHLVTVADGVTHAWATSSWAVLPDAVQPVIGVKHAGVMELGLGDDGEATAAYVRPDGMVDPVIGQSFPSPYTH